MNIKNFVVIGLASIGLLSCNDDTNNIVDENKETAYFSLSLSFPEAQSTKASGSTNLEDGDGYQTGLATEQKFQSVAVVVVRSSNNVVTDYLVYNSSDFAPGGNVAADDNSIVTPQKGKNYETLKSKLVTKGAAKVYVFLNPTADVSSKFAVGSTIANTKIEMTTIDPASITNGIAKADNFLMGNAEPASVVTIDGTANNPTKVTIAVERAAVKLVENTANSSFDITNKLTGVATTFKANLTNFAYNNLNKRSFILKNVETRSDAGAISGSYVVDPNFIEADYNAPSPALPWYGNDFVVIGNQNVTNPFVTTPVITYSLENTMISNEQYQNKTTSIVYKAGIDVDGTTNQTLYTYKGTIYTTYADLKAVYDVDYPGVTDALATLFTVDELAAAYAKTGTEYTDAVKAINTKLAAKGVKCYYQGVCYYNWMIKHWEQDVLLGKMEFGVVRNNVYYLTVTTINNIGEPWIPGGPEDPDPTDPDPDEEEKASILVSINVLPWTVRYNSIEF